MNKSIEEVLLEDISKAKMMLVNISRTNYDLYHRMLAHLTQMQRKIEQAYGLSGDDMKPAESPGDAAQRANEPTKSTVPVAPKEETDEQSSKAEDAEKAKEATAEATESKPDPLAKLKAKKK